MTRFLATAFSPSPCCWYRMQVLTLDAMGQLVSHTPFMGETAATKVCTGLTFAVPDSLIFGRTPTAALAWLKGERGWMPGWVGLVPIEYQPASEDHSTREVFIVGEPHERRDDAVVWCLDGVDPVTGELVPGASLYRLLP